MDEVDNLIAKHSKLTSEQKKLESSYNMIVSELSARKKALKNIVDEVREEGFDPNNLEEEIRRKTEVMKIKLDTWESEIKDSSKVIEPMLREISNA